MEILIFEKFMQIHGKIKTENKLEINIFAFIIYHIKKFIHKTKFQKKLKIMTFT
jgi:hypothetical protein